jgi:hypothetical protein
LIGKDADCHHGKNMVDSADRVGKAMREAGGVADAGMSTGNGRQKAEDGYKRANKEMGHQESRR